MNTEQTSPTAEHEHPPLKKWKLGVLALSLIPFALKFAYLNRAWITSPVDRARLGLWGSGVLLTAVLTAALKATYRFPTDKPLHQSRALRLLLLPAFLYLAGLVTDLNAVQLIASVGIAWLVAWMLYGRTVGFLLGVAAVMAVLAVPGSSYWLGKTSAAFTTPVRAAYAPDFGIRTHPGYLGYELPTDQAFRRFFRTSDAHRYRFASKRDEISVLSVRVGANVHEIHPAAHCLRSSGWRVEREDLRDVSLTGRAEPLPVSEAVVTGAGDRRLVVWSWYSSATESTGSFIRFRHLLTDGADWRSFQLSTALGRDDDLDVARRKLARFLESPTLAHAARTDRNAPSGEECPNSDKR